MPITLKTNGIKIKSENEYSPNEYSPIDAFYMGDVEAWLDEHPEATTTVQDGSISEQKLTDALRLKTVNDYVTPIMFGAVGDGVEDDTQALLNCASYCTTHNVALVIPENCTVKLPQATVIDNVKQISAQGTIIAPNGVTFRGRSSQIGYEWEFSNISGDIVLEGLKSSIIKIVYATSLTLHADSTIDIIDSISYNQFILGYVPTVLIEGYGLGWINENFFYGGRISNLTFANSGSYCHNNNHFFNSSFESANIELYHARGNYIHNARFEGEQNTIVLHSTAYANTIQRAWTGERVPSVIIPNWTDENGGNYYCVGPVPAVKVYEKNITPYSFNYDVTKAYPLNGKLHCVQVKSDLFATNLIPIEHPIAVNIRSDIKFFRASVTCYNSNKEKITTKPSVNPFYSDNLKWREDGSYYYVGDEDQNSFAYTIGKKNYSGQDSGVSYIRISIYSSGADIDGLYCSITAPQYVNFDPFKPDKLIGTAAPAAGNWNEGTMVYNIDSSTPVLGWYYHNSSWHEIGLS